jgi:hypothetical protein
MLWQMVADLHRLSSRSASPCGDVSSPGSRNRDDHVRQLSAASPLTELLGDPQADILLPRLRA